jgi:hypothetical protein
VSFSYFQLISLIDLRLLKKLKVTKLLISFVCLLGLTACGGGGTSSTVDAKVTVLGISTASSVSAVGATP